MPKVYKILHIPTATIFHNGKTMFPQEFGRLSEAQNYINKHLNNTYEPIQIDTTKGLQKVYAAIPNPSIIASDYTQVFKSLDNVLENNFSRHFFHIEAVLIPSIYNIPDCGWLIINTKDIKRLKYV